MAFDGSVLRWLLSHTSEARLLVELVPHLVAADSIEARWTALKPIGDVIVSIAKDFPIVPEDAMNDGPPVIESDAIEAGFDFDTLKKLAAILIQILPYLLPLLDEKKTTV